MTTQQTIPTVSLGQLVPSQSNVRRVNAVSGIAELADSIEAHGLIQNIVVRRADKGSKYEVVAGARRLAALRLLLKEGRGVQGEPVTKAFPVRSLTLLDDQIDTEISLAENVQRDAMHVVDEVLAYKWLVDEGKAVEDVAARFGQSPITVRKRLKLANLSPRILDVLREDGMSLEQAKALALTDDRRAQEAAWFDRQDWNRQPHGIRSALTQDHIRASDRLAVFVGLEAYEAAGGGVMRDLFADEDSIFLTDRTLLVQLATERLHVVMEELREQDWKWVDVTFEQFSFYNGDYGRVQPVARELTEAEAEQMAALEATMAALAEQMEAVAEEDPAVDELEAHYRECEASARKLGQSAMTYTSADRELAGCMIYLDHAGAIQVAYGLVTADDRAALARQRRGEAVAEVGSNAGTTAPTPVGYSATLVQELTTIRTAALRVELAARPEVALAALLFPLVSALFVPGARWDSPVEISGQRRDLACGIKEPEDCRPLREWAALMDAWAERIPGDPADLWDWLRAQPLDVLHDLLALVTAANLNAIKGPHDDGSKRLAQADALATAVELDMAAWWEPAQPFLSRLSKAEIAEAVKDVGGSEDAIKATLRGTKADAIDLAQQELHGSGWLPHVLRQVVKPAIAENPDTSAAA